MEVVTHEGDEQLPTVVSSLWDPCFFGQRDHIIEADVEITLVYHYGSFYCTMKDVKGEQELVDRFFPQIGRRGNGYQIKTYDGHDVYRKITLWQTVQGLGKRPSLEEVQQLQRDIRGQRGEGEGKSAEREEKTAGAQGDSEAEDSDDDPDWLDEVGRNSVLRRMSIPVIILTRPGVLTCFL